jgi:hypothetical protein
MDGRGVSMFGKIWAKNVDAVSHGRHLPEALEHEFLDRTPAFGNGTREMELSAFDNYRLTKQVWRNALQREIWEAAISGDPSHPRLQLLKKLDLCYWSVSQESLLSVKQAASVANPNAPIPTESTILSALLWRHISKARGLSAKGYKTTSLVNVVNIRGRLEPPLPLNYAGNALTHAKATASVTDVESEMPLIELAALISDSIDWWTSEKIWGFIKAIDSTPHVGKV